MRVLEKYQNGCQNRDFPCPDTVWSGFGIFDQNRGDPNETGMVGQSAVPMGIILRVRNSITKKKREKNVAMSLPLSGSVEVKAPTPSSPPLIT